MNNRARRTRLSFVAVIATLASPCAMAVVVPSRASALSCMQPEFQRDFDRAALVFQGVAKNSTTQTTTPSSPTVEFAVTRVWKGAPESVRRLKVNGVWGPSFTAGDAYVVFADDEQSVSPCSLTTPVSQAGALLAKLGEGQAPRPPSEAADGGVDGAAMVPPVQPMDAGRDTAGVPRADAADTGNDPAPSSNSGSGCTMARGGSPSGFGISCFAVVGVFLLARARRRQS